MYALIQHGTVWELFERNPNLTRSLDVRDVSKQAGIAVGWVANEDGTYSIPPAPAEPVPASVTSAQAKIQLSRAKFLPAVKAAVEAMGGEVEIWFTDARTWHRENAYVNEIGDALGMSASDKDTLFREAAKIDA